MEERGGCFTGPEWLLDKEQWPDQPKLTSIKYANQEYRLIKQTAYHVGENVSDEWDTLLDRNPYWRSLRITAWVLRFVNNSLYKKRGLKEKRPVDTGEIEVAKKYWIRRVQRNVLDETEVPGWRPV